MKTKIKYEIKAAAHSTGFNYLVKRLASNNGGATFWWAGIGKYVNTMEEANDWMREDYDEATRPDPDEDEEDYDYDD